MKGNLPPRPTLTIVFTSAVLFWAGCAIAYSSGSVWDGSVADTVLAVAAAIFVGMLALVVLEKTRFAAIMIASVAVGVLLGSSQASYVHSCSSACEDLEGERFEVELLEDSVNLGFGETALVSANTPSGARAQFSARLGDTGPLLTGQRVAAYVTFKPVDYSEDSYAWNDGSSGQLTCKASELQPETMPLGVLISLRAATIEAIGADDESHALLQALVCGYRRNIRDTELYAQFQTCGLAHLVAVSGAHLVIVTGLFASLLKSLRAPRKLTIAILISIMLAYYVIAGMPVSALRATIMSALGLLSFFGKRRPSSINAVGVGVYLIIVMSPSSSVSASFALSALSTAGIVLFGPLVQTWLERTPLASFPFACDSLSLTIASSLLSQLYACSLFSQLPVIGPVANIMTAPLFPLVCGFGLVAGLGEVALSGTAGLLSTTSGLVASVLAMFVEALAHIPFASVPFTIDTCTALGVTAILSITLWAWWPRSGLRAIVPVAFVCLASVLAFTLSVGSSDRIVMLDVGQGDAILVQSRGQTMLVDTGNKDSKLQRELALNHISHLDTVLITHADDDHFGSLDQIDRSVDVDRVVVAHDMLDCTDSSARELIELAKRSARDVVGVRQGDTFPVGAFSVRVLWPNTFTADGGNADSLCLMLEYDGDGDSEIDSRALMTGDAEKEELASMVEEGLLGKIDVLKVGHHGSRNGMTADEARILQPEVALISCGLHNRYGHPAPETLDILEKIDSKVFRTDLDGEITCIFATDKISVTSAK